MSECRMPEERSSAHGTIEENWELVCRYLDDVRTKDSFRRSSQALSGVRRIYADRAAGKSRHGVGDKILGSNVTKTRISIRA